MCRKWVVCRTLLFVSLLWAVAGSASVSFRTAVGYGVGSNLMFVAQGDFNADGKSELVVINVGDPRAATSTSSRLEGIPNKFRD